MKLIIAGSRNISHISPVIMHSFLEAHRIDWRKIDQIVSGTANGIDTCGENFAHCLDIELERFPADWDKHGKAAGPIRNKQMADYSDALLLIWDGESSGSKNMKTTMLKQNKPVYEVILNAHKKENKK
jgi:predicted Rossmann fold nucleotide-binding protein DprA/Smf involved in DNA uptake